MTPEFENIEKVDPRSIWSHEAHDFTPWLADNLDRLGEAVGIDLELVAREAVVGGFSLDILAKDLGRNSNVIIENQLGSTDHDHLGKLITYASGYDADVVMWISTEIREEHRQALDWLNQRTDSKTDFFGVTIEIIRIGDSKPALQFKVAVSPNEWQKNRKKDPTAQGSERSELYRAYFQELIDELREKHKFTSARKGQPQNWYSFSSGRRSFTYGHSFAAKGNVRVEIYIDSGDLENNKHRFDELFQNREIIESELQEKLTWERLDDKRACRIALYREGSIEWSSEELQMLRDWAIQRLLRFKQVFGKRLELV
jgi:hypothetical protein